MCLCFQCAPGSQQHLSGMQQCLRGCPQGCYRTLLKAPTASTSITLQSMKDMDLYWTRTYKLMLTMLFKIMHWIGPEGCQAKKMIANIPPATHSIECGMCNVSSPDKLNFSGWTGGMGLPQSCYCLPLAASSRLYSPCQKTCKSQSQQGALPLPHPLGDVCSIIRIQAWPSVFFFPGKVL